MLTRLDIESFLIRSQNPDIPVIDVRSPGEFASGHLPGAYNLPLFDDAGRKEVGLLYKQKGREAALLKGLDLVGPRMRTLVEQAQALAPQKELLAHCWRGGMRSESLAWLWNQAGLQVSVLQGGYKAYRHHIREQLGRPLPLVVLGGATGSGKTDLLHALAAQGEQVIDLEGLANHKGSVFGHLLQPPQPSNEQFENDLFAQVQALDPGRPIWIEDESIHIGRVGILYPFWSIMEDAPVVAVEVPLEARVARLVREYAQAGDDALRSALERIRKRLGGLRLQAALQALEASDYPTVARLALEYYDTVYAYALEKRPAYQVFSLPLEKDDPAYGAEKLIQFFHHQPSLRAIC